jgi:aminoglycoside 3-N-acetyltransferase
MSVRAPERRDQNATQARSRITRERLVGELRALGVRSGQTLIVHASLRRIGWVESGATAVVAALREALGPDGTLVAGAGTPENSLTSRTFHHNIKGLNYAKVSGYVEQMPAFDPQTTPTSAGAVAEALRITPGAVRSHHPQSSFVAVGRDARELMAGHKRDCHLGEDSPLAKLYQRGASILLLGVGYQSCTAFHLAEYRYTEKPPMRTYSCRVIEAGNYCWLRYQDVVLDDGEFEKIGHCLELTIPVTMGTVGKAQSRLFPLPLAVDFARDWLAANRR